MDLASARERFDRLIEQAKSACAFPIWIARRRLSGRAANLAWLRHSGQFYSARSRNVAERYISSRHQIEIREVRAYIRQREAPASASCSNASVPHRWAFAPGLALDQR